jgi:hypothetical protein
MISARKMRLLLRDATPKARDTSRKRPQSFEPKRKAIVHFADIANDLKAISALASHVLRVWSVASQRCVYMSWCFSLLFGLAMIVQKIDIQREDLQIGSWIAGNLDC